MKYLLLLYVFLTLHATSDLPLQHAKIYKNQNISTWVMSEKLDGIRGYWDGDAFYTKGGKRLSPPLEFTQGFPPFGLDGELWTKRQDFENIQSQVLAVGSRWEGISYHIFEVPNAKGGFLQRLKKARAWFKIHSNQNVKIIPQYHCPDKKSLNTYLEQIIAKGGEGVMIKNPNLPYTAGRTSTMLKVKKAQDMEGIVVGINWHTDNKHLKSLILKLKNGVEFKLGNGFTKSQRLNPPSVGANVTFKYYGFSKYGKPKFASFIRVKAPM